MRAGAASPVVCALAAALVLPLAGPAGAEPPAPAKPSPAPAPPKPAPAPNAADKPGRTPPKAGTAGEPVTAPQPVRVTKTFWYTDRRVALWVHSPAMNTDIQVQLLLARDWWSRPTAKFPQMTMLDGLRAQDDQNGWVINTNIVDFYADKNLNVILPIGGESSFTPTGSSPTAGRRTSGDLPHQRAPDGPGARLALDGRRGIEGLSMGGTATNDARGAQPGFYKFAASFSGILQMTSLGMQPAIQFAMRDAGGYDSQKMFRPAQ